MSAGGIGTFKNIQVEKRQFTVFKNVPQFWGDTAADSPGVLLATQIKFGMYNYSLL